MNKNISIFLTKELTKMPYFTQYKNLKCTTVAIYLFGVALQVIDSVGSSQRSINIITVSFINSQHHLFQFISQYMNNAYARLESRVAKLAKCEIPLSYKRINYYLIIRRNKVHWPDIIFC